MSFILDALKKSEQQRQNKNAPPQDVRKRTLSRQDRRQSRWPYWTVAGVLFLTLLCGWWFFNGVDSTRDQASVTNQTPVSPSSPDQSERHQAVVQKPLVRQGPVAELEAAPVPRDVPLPAVVPVQSSTTGDTFPVEQDEPTEVVPSARITTNQPVAAKVVPEQARSEVVIEPTTETMPAKLPLYLDLSRELRDQMPRLAMSMHYYIDDPARRMVRINDLMLHEGDWISNDLQVMEISPTGATLDYLGKLFEMRSGSR